MRNLLIVVLSDAKPLSSDRPEQRLPAGSQRLPPCAPLTGELVAALPAVLFDGFVLARGPGSVDFAFGAYLPRRPIAEAVAELAPGADVDHVEPYLVVNCGLTEGGAHLGGVSDLWTATTGDLHGVLRDAAVGWHPAVVDLVERIDPATLRPTSVRRSAPTPSASPGPR